MIISFFFNKANNLTVIAELIYNDNYDNPIDTSLIILKLAERIEKKPIDFPGLHGEFVMLPRYATEEVQLNLWLNSDKLFKGYGNYQKICSSMVDINYI